MDAVVPIIVAIVLLVLAVPIGLFVAIFIKLNKQSRRLNQLEDWVAALHRDLRQKEKTATPPTITPEMTVAVTVATPPPLSAVPPTSPEHFRNIPPVAPPVPVVAEMPTEHSRNMAPPPLLVSPAPPPSPGKAEVASRGGLASLLPGGAKSGINWEMFMGVKLFAWIGGLVLFLGVAFFVKYSFENNLITPEMRVALGYLTGVGLLVGGLVLARKTFPVLGQTLCATSILVLYANTFATSAFYHFLGPIPAFVVMSLITVTAFALAARMDAQVVSVLGLLGGFLTPVLLSTGKDNPLGLFGYVALLDAGVIAVVTRKRWNYQTALAALGTVAILIGWTAKFFAAEKIGVAMGAFLGFEVLFLVAFRFGDRENLWSNIASVAMAFVPLVFALWLMLDCRVVARKPWLLFSFVLAADVGMLALTLLRTRLARVHVAAGSAVFFVLAVWNGEFVNAETLNWALGFYFVFALLHAVFPLALARLRPEARTGWGGQVFPLVALMLVLLSISRMPELTWLVWVCVLAIDVLVFVLAVTTGFLLAIVGALVLTLMATGIFLVKIPAEIGGVTELLVVIGGFALVFFAVGVFAAKRLAMKPAGDAGVMPRLPAWATMPSFRFAADVRAQIPALSAVLPFLLLIMVVARMPLANPTPVFGLALVLVALLLGVARWTAIDLLAALGLGCVAALEYAWRQRLFKADAAPIAVTWHVIFTAVFFGYPFLFRKEMKARVLPWAVSALSGVAHFRLVHAAVSAAWPNPVMGVLPAVFALPPLVGLVVMARGESEKRLSQLAWFGGAALFFVTLIFPIQFEKQWITIGWALEGAALLWLWHRVPHNGLRWVGTGLLCAAFARLALNPSVLDYHHRGATAILNWYLYAYGITTVCLFVGAKLAAPREETKPALAWMTAVLASLGTVLAFLLLNIEIADYFTEPGASSLVFRFSGNFTRDMTCSIAWALFALALLIAGIAKKIRAARYASMALLVVTLGKLFFHDLKQLGQLQRIGAFVGVAVILLAASFLYQKFVPSEAQPK
jgi:uncharacterized membrane protein